MPKPRRATVYLDPALHRALRVKAAETERSVSDLVSAAALFEDRAREPVSLFEDVLKDLRRRGKV